MKKGVLLLFLLILCEMLIAQGLDPQLDSLLRPLPQHAGARKQAERLDKILNFIFMDGNLEFGTYPAQLDSIYHCCLMNQTKDRIFEKSIAAKISLYRGADLAIQQVELATPVLNQALQQFGAIADTTSMALVYMELTFVASSLGDSLSFAKNHDLVLNVLKGVKDPYACAALHNNIGIGCYNFGRYAEGAAHYFTALESVEKYQTTPLRLMKRDIYHNLTGIYKRIEDYENGLIYIRKAIESAEANRQNPADHYISMAGIYQAINDYEKALKTYQKAEENLVADMQPIIFAALNYGKSNCYRNLGDIKSALQCAQKAVQLLPIEQDAHFGAAALEELAACEFSAGMHQNALKNALLTYQTFLKAKNNGGLVRTAQLLSNIYTFQKNYPKALEYSELRFKYQQQIERQQSTRQLAFGEFTRNAAAEKARREAEVQAQLTQQRNIRYALFAGLGILVLLTFLLYNRYRLKQRTTQQLEAKNLEVEAARARAEASEAFKSRFLANMSHEIRTPLHGIAGFTDLLLETSLNEKQRRWLSSIHHSTDRLGEVVNDILDLSKLEAGEVKLRQIPFSPARVAGDVQEALSLRAEQKGIELTLKVDENIPEALLGDPTRLYQILMNLVGNAVKFTETGSVRIKVSSDPQSITNGQPSIGFSVTDTGIGIPPEKLAAIFDSFQQAGEDTTARFGGTGLGLTIARELVQLYGSDIQVASQVGKGSTFSFVLALPMSDAEDLRTNSTKGDILHFTQPLRILLADDNTLNLEIATEAICRHFENAEIVEVKTGKEAVTEFQSGAFDLILMDMQMPEMTGTEATRYIRQQLSSDIPIIALTASATPEEIENALESGMNRHLSKPFKPMELAQVVAEVLGLEGSVLVTKVAEKHQDPAANTTGTDLAFLRDFCDGDEVQMQHFIQKFLSQYPLEIKRLEDALAREDREALYQAAHSFRPQLEFVGLSEAAGQALLLERGARVGLPVSTLMEFMKQINALLDDLPKAYAW